MGYTTDFVGTFSLDKPLTVAHKNYLTRFAETRRMNRNPEMTVLLPDPIRAAVELPIGLDGGFYVGDEDSVGQSDTGDIVNYNQPPSDQPGLWCQWIPTEDGTGIEWDGGEKFYYYVQWLNYLIANFLGPWGYVLNGEVEWQGEARGAVGKIIVEDNEVKAEGRE